VAAARARTREIAPADVAAAQQAGAVVVDLREPEELQRQGRIPGAVHVPRGMLEWRADPASPSHDPALAPERPVVLYCAGGGRSALAADALRALGYQDVSHLGAGFGGWVSAGQPVERVEHGAS
jgi:rhodanese-related sulfurtransferase